VTDFGAATISDRVIARDSLLDECQDKGIPASPFSQFFDVIKLIRHDESLL
jgi:2-hydroxy-3-keto-5-methylthiopentenyl-1-phosphate phosphatase